MEKQHLHTARLTDDLGRLHALLSYVCAVYDRRRKFTIPSIRLAEWGALPRALSTLAEASLAVVERRWLHEPIGDNQSRNTERSLPLTLENDGESKRKWGEGRPLRVFAFAC